VRSNALMTALRAANPVEDCGAGPRELFERILSEPREGAQADRRPATAPGDRGVASHPGEARGRRLPTRPVLAAFVAVAALATGGLLALAPGGGSSGFLARAATALAPAKGTILYERWETTIGTEPGNPESQAPRTFGPEQLWIESDHPRR
jgi:hypothetical protein